MVLNADKVRRRISLSLKQLQERPQGVVDEGPHDYADYTDDEDD